MKKIIFMLAAAATMASCSKTEIYENGQAAGPDIIAKSAHQLVSGELSRAPFIGQIAADNHLEARVLTFGSTLLCDGTFKFTSQATTAYDFDSLDEGDGKYPTPLAANYYMAGVYPAGSWSGAESGVTTVLTHAITGHDDIMAAEMVTITQADIENEVAPTLAFRHLLTKFEVKVKARDAASASAWTEVTDIKLTAIADPAVNMPGTISYKLDDGTVTLGGSPVGSYGFFGIDNGVCTDVSFATAAIQENGGNQAVAYAMVAPFKSTSNNDVTITVTADGEDYDVKVNIPARASTAGYGYTVSLIFANEVDEDDKIIIAGATVDEWAIGGETEHIIIN